MDQLPVLMSGPQSLAIIPSDHELALLHEARGLHDAGYHAHSLLNLWNAAVCNLRRRVEAYGVDLWLSVVKEEPGRKKIDRDGETLADRWGGVDELVLITGAQRLGLVNRKGGKALEMINWTRNHASPAHDSDSPVGPEDVLALALLLQSNLFDLPMPDPGHSIAGLFDPVRNVSLDQAQIDLLCDQIRALNPADIRNAFGFLLDLLGEGQLPASANASVLLPVVWEKANDDLKKTAGLRYHTVRLDPTSDSSTDNGMDVRILDFLTQVGGVKYIPDATRAQLYRRAAKLLGDAKDSSYGWKAEETAAETLVQFGPHVPNIAFEEVYQEIVSACCGNYWGHSGAGDILSPFITTLNTEQVRRLVGLFCTNERVRSELFQSKPKARALKILAALKDSVTIAAHKSEVDSAIAEIDAL
ncbi:hypothetical protein BC777_0095 [Yoonia maricola]|uniref:Uncharacterized protein n=1 Tax=Yoonia maricola TaxID=420999 RepID=A0A2M8WK13_9RHOB|nr:hypothetical protein [Yoonia maricola]PJI91271.1 hypothetical protein BC777_0095 [Yoonia maricola]